MKRKYNMATCVLCGRHTTTKRSTEHGGFYCFNCKQATKLFDEYQILSMIYERRFYIWEEIPDSTYKQIYALRERIRRYTSKIAKHARVGFPAFKFKNTDGRHYSHDDREELHRWYNNITTHTSQLRDQLFVDDINK